MIILGKKLTRKDDQDTTTNQASRGERRSLVYNT